MDRVTPGEVTASGPASPTPAAPRPTVAQAKARFLAAAEAIDPAKLIRNNPATSLTTAAALGLIAGHSKGLPNTVLASIDSIAKLVDAAARLAPPPAPESDDEPIEDTPA